MDKKIKSPSLPEAYKIMFNKDITNHHDSYSDALYSSRIFFAINHKYYIKTTIIK